MKVTLLTYGSRGDVQPFLALAVRLQQANHTPTLATPPRFANLIQPFGVKFVPLAGDPDELSRMFNQSGSNLFGMVRAMKQHLFRIAPEVVRAARSAIRDADILVHSFAFTTGAHSLARELGIPDVSIQLFPMFAPTRAFAAVGAPQRMPGWLNWLSHWMFTQIFWHGGNLGYYQLRHHAPTDFPKRLYWAFTPQNGRVRTPLIFAISPAVLASPPEWNKPHIHTTGYFFLDEADYQPPDALRRFLDAGAPPVCITFGSMVNRRAETLTRAALKAIVRTGNRAIFLTGWGGWQPENPPEGAFFMEGAPHHWLLPRCKAILHHGGAGTTAAGLRAGIPAIIVPHTADQPFWGARVAALGAGAVPIPIHHLDAARVEHALHAIESAQIRLRAAQLGEVIRREDGTGNAVAIIETHAVNNCLH
ncbi:MAG: glycosyltransferase [Anaerolineales bacterium]